MSRHRHLESTPVHASLCGRCRHPLLTAHVEGLRAFVDPVALDGLGETLAVLTGRWTYTLTRTELVQRDAGKIRSGHLSGPTLAEHRCHQPLPAAQQKAASPIVDRHDERIPF